MIHTHEIEEALRTMTPRSKLFALVKKEMKDRGHWKNKPRGKANMDIGKHRK